MTQLVLYFAPDTCARVTMVALEEIGQPYEVEVIEFMAGQHRSKEYLELNPSGKVPTLLVDLKPLSENPAILTYLHRRFPDADLLPAADNDFAAAQVLSDLSYCASGLHPLVTRIRIPRFFCDIEDSAGRVVEMATSALRLNFEIIETRLRHNKWWYGEQWSILDAYINWVYFRVTGAGFDAADYPNFISHDERNRERPSVRRALEIGQHIYDDLESRGLAVKFDGPGAVNPAADAVARQNSGGAATIGKPE